MGMYSAKYRDKEKGDKGRVTVGEVPPSEIPRIPVVGRQDPTQLLGMLRRQDIIKGYAKIVAKIHRSENENPRY
jgi:hypothetical protein